VEEAHAVRRPCAEDKEEDGQLLLLHGSMLRSAQLLASLQLPARW
jgi:hypothetical protein